MTFQKLLSQPIFWFSFALGALGMFALSLWQLDWLSYLWYPSVWHQIAFLSPDVLLAELISVLVGFNLACFVVLQRSCPNPVAGASGLFGAIAGFFAFYCAACQATLFTIFGLVVGAELLAPWVPVFKYASVALLLIGVVLLLKKIRDPSCKIGS